VRYFRRFDQARRHPRFLQDVLVVKLEAMKIEFDRGPGVAFAQRTKIIGELGCGQIIDIVVKKLTAAANGARIGIDGFWLQAFECEMLQQALVLSVERDV
jgi:hypothetical protein